MKDRYVAYLLIASGLLVMLHQFAFFGKLFEVSDVHHELFMFSLVFSGAVILLLPRLRKRRLAR